MYKENRRTQALLSEVESEIVLVLSALDIDNIDQAEYAAVRGLLAARGAHASRPEASMTKGAVKVAEAYHALVRGYRAGLNSDFDGAIDLAGQAYRLGDEAKSISPDLAQIVENVQKNAGAMADNARVLKSQSTPEAGGVG
jgi:hypothetical protein